MFFNNTLVYMTVQDSILNKYVLSRHDYSKGAPVRSTLSPHRPSPHRL